MAPRPPVSRVPIANPRRPIPKSSSCHPSCRPTGKTSVEDSSLTWWSPNDNPEFATVLKVVRTLGRLRAATRVTCHGE